MLTCRSIVIGQCWRRGLVVHVDGQVRNVTVRQRGVGGWGDDARLDLHISVDQLAVGCKERTFSSKLDVFKKYIYVFIQMYEVDRQTGNKPI